MIYLCSSGTSAAKYWPKEKLGWYSSESIEKCGGREAAIRILVDGMDRYSMDNDEHLCKLSAEIHSLARMPLKEADTVVLFSSETIDGHVCAQAVAAYLKKRGYEVVVEQIPGLQVHDAVTFARQGVVSYIKTALGYIDAYGNTNTVLVPTGGFKALVPYSVLLGMIRKVECMYIFERSTRLIHFPSLPVDFSHAGLENIKIVLETIERESAIPVARFQELLSWEQHNEFKVLFEKEGEEVTLSAIGFLMLEELQKPSPLTPYISREAMTGLLKLKSMADVHPEAYLLRVAGNRAKLESAKHGNAGEGLFWLKPGNTTDRYLVSIEDDWKLLIWEMHDHTSYDERSKEKNLGKAVRSKRTQKYAPFFRLELQD